MRTALVRAAARNPIATRSGTFGIMNIDIEIDFKKKPLMRQPE